MRYLFLTLVLLSAYSTLQAQGVYRLRVLQSVQVDSATYPRPKVLDWKDDGFTVIAQDFDRKLIRFVGTPTQDFLWTYIEPRKLADTSTFLSSYDYSVVDEKGGVAKINVRTTAAWLPYEVLVTIKRGPRAWLYRALIESTPD